MKRALLPLLVLLTVVLLFSGGQAWAQFIPSNHVSTTLEGCRNNGTITLPINGQFVCPDAAYTTGNLGKGWNELDLVPHRLTTQVGTQATATTDFSVIVAGDYQTSGHIGWDVISVPAVNTAKSDGSCSVSAGPQSTEGTPQNPFGGGTDVAIYRQLNIHQNKGTTCVFDYVQRLALGAHLYPGSSLQSYMFESQDFSTGKKTISIPVNEILPQSISKDMSATQGSDHTWTVSKDPSPATVSFSDTCNLQNPSSSGVQITVKWTKLAAVPGGPITVVTHVYATNPAARSITVNVSDVIYSGTTPLDTAGPTSTIVAPNTANYLVLTHTTTVPSGTTNLNDIATATYTDAVTGVPVPGNTQATASADVQLSGPEKNNSATINDTESLGGGAGFLFSADSFTPAVGAFDSPYIAGTQTEGPVGWTSNSQTGSGQVTFNKTIYTGQGNANSDVLSDTATLNGSDGFTAGAGASINISAHAFVALTINKTVTPAMPAGVSQTFTFHVYSGQLEVATASVTVAGGQSTGSTVVKDLAPGTYTVTEDTVSGFTTDDPQSATITLPSCSGGVTFHNTRGAHLKLVKVVNNNHGGTAVATDFTLSATGPQTISGAGGAESDVDVGTYSLSETNVTGYTASSWSCVGGSQSGSSITLAAGDNATCTITNSDQPAHLKLVKVVVNDNGGTAKTTDFTLSASGPTPLSGAGGAESDVSAGTYNLSETNLAGYTAGSWSCVGGTQNGSSVALALGESATCTITNDDQTAHLKLVKTVTNDNGGTAKTTDFTLSASGPTPLSGAGGAESDVNAGSYNLSETNLAGYTAGSWSCVGGTQNGSSVTLALGQSATCTINNNDQTAHLKLVKTVTNDNGGTAKTTDFTLSAAGPTPLSGAGGAESDVNAGSYNLSETNLAGYTAGSWSCVGGTQNGSSVTLALGQSATCTINNNDQPAHLKLVKVVVNDNGGTAKTTDFTLSASGPTPLSGAGGTESDVSAGTYNLSETNVAGYTAGSWSCVGGTQNGSSVALALGQSATCTITNDDQTAHLKLVKTVTNDNGGTAVATDFTLSASGPTPLSGAGGAESDVNAGSYNLSETNLAGYTAGSWSCVGGTQNGSSVALALGQSATCTINNNDQPAHLKLVKTVTNDNGGTAVAGDFTLSAAGPTPISGAGGTESDVSAGSYTLSETTLATYTAGSWSCVGGTQNGSSVTLALGQSATCTINNNDKPAHLKLVKVVVNDNGGTAKTTDFTLSASGPTPLSGAGGAESDVSAGTYNLSETNVAGYTASSWSCVGGTQNGSSVSLALGQSATCTITNNDQIAHLTLIKTVINDNGGTKVVSDFALFISGTSATSGVKYDLNAGTYTASETQLYGYTASGWGGACSSNGSVTLKPGDDKTCTITNNDLPGTIIVKKIVKSGVAGMFTFNTTGTGYNGFTIPGGSQNSQTLNVGTYTVMELVPFGWTLTGIGGSTDPNAPYACTVTGSGGSYGIGDLNTQTATVSLKNGDTVTCVFENTGLGATRTQGFWATHPQLANIAWSGGTGYGHTFPGVAAGMGDTSVCGRPLDLTAVMGGFWSSIPRLSTGAKRTPLDQLRMQLLQQLLAAELNMSAFGTVPPGGVATLQSWENALCGINSAAIRNAQQQAGAFNSLGDNSTFTPGTSADAKTARSVANIPFWDIIKP